MSPDRIHVPILAGLARGEADIEGALVTVTTAVHLSDQALVSKKEGLPPPFPPERFRMAGIAVPALGEDRPDRMQFTMLTEQMRAAEPLR